MRHGRASIGFVVLTAMALLLAPRPADVAGEGKPSSTTKRIRATSLPVDLSRIRVACLGDSITAGARTKDRSKESYPARLQALLGPRWNVRNFGLGGATLLRRGRPNIWKNVPAAKRFKPHLVIIMLGTNDTVGGRRKNWQRIGEFPRDAKRLIKEFAKLGTRPEIFLCSPTAMVLETRGLSAKRRAALIERKPRIEILRRKIEQIAEQTGVHFVDMTAVLEGRPDLIYRGDGVHPNAKGYEVLAKRFFDEIRKHSKHEVPTTQPAR